MSTLLKTPRRDNAEPAPLCVDCVAAPALRGRGLCVGCDAARGLERLTREVSRYAGESAILAQAALSAILETGPGAGRFDWPSARGRLILAALRFAVQSVGDEMEARGRLVLAALETAADADDGLAGDLEYLVRETVEFRRMCRTGRAMPVRRRAEAVRVVKDPRSGRGGENLDRDDD